MKHVEYYVANDGTQFDDEQECFEYELELKAKTLTEDLLLWSHHHDVLPLTSAGYEEAMYVCANTEEAAQFLDDLAGTIGQIPPWGYGNALRSGKWIYVGDGARGFDWLEFGELEDFYNTCEVVFNSVP